MARYRRLVMAFLLLVGANVALAVGYWLINQGRTNPDGSAIDFLQCLYMTVISTFTVGYGEVLPIVTPADKIYTMIVIVLGLGTMGYGISQMTAFMVKGNYWASWRGEKWTSGLRRCGTTSWYAARGTWAVT